MKQRQIQRQIQPGRILCIHDDESNDNMVEEIDELHEIEENIDEKTVISSLCLSRRWG